MSENQACPCEHYTMFPIKGFGLAMDTSEMEKRLPDAEHMAHAAMPSPVSVDIPLDEEPRPDLLAARTTFTAPADGYVWAQGRRPATATADFSSVSIHLLDAAGQSVLEETGFFYTPGYQSVHLPVSRGAQARVQFQHLESGAIRFVYCNGAAPKQ